MSTATYNGQLHAVPDIATTKARLVRFGLRKELRRRAYRAYYTALSLARATVGWALTQLHRGVEVTRSIGALSWLGGQLRNGIGLMRQVGVVPSVLAILSAPPIAAAAGRAARFIGKGILRVASATWTGITALLARGGSTGTRIIDRLSRIGTQVADSTRSVAKQPMMSPVVHVMQATLSLVRPVSQGLVTHRLLGALVPVLWLRTLLGLLVMPFLIDTALVGKVQDWAGTPTQTGPLGSDVLNTDDTETLLLVNASVTNVQAPMNGDLPPDEVQVEDAEQSQESGPPLNREERRALQREEARARRTRSRQ